MVLAIMLSFSHLAMGLADSSKPLTYDELAQRLQKYQGLSTLEAPFTETKTIKDIDVVVKSEGRLILSRPETHSHKVVWKILKPSPMTASLSEDQVKIETGVGEEKNIQVFKLADLPSGNMAQNMTALMAWLDLDAGALSKIYEVVVKDKNRFSFTPKQKGISPFKELILILDDHGNVKTVNITENSQDTLALDFGVPKMTYKKK